MSHDQQKLVEGAAYVFAGVAAISFAQLAYVVTIVAGIISAMLGVIRLHDRIRYGPVRDR